MNLVSLQSYPYINLWLFIWILAFAYFLKEIWCNTAFVVILKSFLTRLILNEWKQKIQMIRISIHLRFSGIWCSVACWEKSVRFWQQQQQVVFGSLGMNPHGGMTMTSRQHSLLILVLNFYQVEWSKAIWCSSNRPKL